MRTLFGKVTYSVFRNLAFFDSYLNLQMIAAVTPREHKITFIDERIKDLKLNKKYDLVGISCTTGLSPRAYELGDKLQEMGIPVVLGGPHVTCCPDDAKKHADSVVVGEAELVWPKLIKDLGNGTLQPYYQQEDPIDPALIPPARRDIVKGFFPVARLQATRGCPYGCEFCSVPTIEKRKLRKRPIENVIDEIKHIKQKFLIFSDASLTIDPEYTKILFKEMAGLRKKFACFGNSDVLANDEEFVRLSKKAGCHTWHVGFESISQDTINDLGKTTNKVEDYRKVVKNLHDNNIAISAAFIVGLDNDKKDVFDKIIKAAFELNIDLLEINMLTPFPGTPLYERLDRENRIVTKDWRHYKEGQSGTQAVFKPKNMTAEELREGIDQIFWKWLSNKNQLRISMRTIKYGMFPFLYTFFSSHFFI